LIPLIISFDLKDLLKERQNKKTSFPELINAFASFVTLGSIG
jgi:hypothetical protein